ncbi:hypothetical protein ET013_09770 [Lactococcus garvieae]|nr:hypothetical protein [Lactococcus garvieae]NHJ06352.1 hypothetical protein [Lactococcus garvieae]
MTALEAKDDFLALVRQLVESDTGFTLSDVLDNDFSSVLEVIQDKNKSKEKTEHTSLGDFMKTL